MSLPCSNFLINSLTLTLDNFLPADLSLCEASGLRRSSLLLLLVILHLTMFELLEPVLKGTKQLI